MVLVFPEPVGPVKSSRPLVCLSRRLSPSSESFSKPSVFKSNRRSRGSNNRDYNLLAAGRRENRNAQLHVFQFRPAHDAVPSWGMPA